MESPRFRLGTAWVLSSLCALGCSSGLDGVEKRLSAMREEITALQNQNDRLVERMDALEVKQARAEAKSKAPVASEATTERPPLKVVRLEPGAEPGAPQTGDVAAGEAADDPSPRTVIRGRGSNVEGRLASGELLASSTEPEGRHRKSNDGESSRSKDESPKKGD